MKKYILIFLIGLFAMNQSKAHVALIYPNGGETFSPGETITVEWQVLVAHNTLNWDLLFSSDGGNTWDTIQADIHVDSLTYQWLVPEIPTTQGRIKIVQDNEGADYFNSCADFTILSPSGINKQIALNDFKVYPNPASNKVNISVEGFELEEVNFYTLTGQKLFATRPEYGSVDVSQFQKGMYILEVTVGNIKLTKKLVVE